MQGTCGSRPAALRKPNFKDMPSVYLPPMQPINSTFACPTHLELMTHQSGEETRGRVASPCFGYRYIRPGPSQASGDDVARPLGLGLVRMPLGSFLVKPPMLLRVGKATRHVKPETVATGVRNCYPSSPSLRGNLETWREHAPEPVHDETPK